MNNHPNENHMKHECENQRECLELLQSILDGEASAEQKSTFMKKHLEECMPCFKNYHLEVAIRTLLKSKCSGQPAPQELVDSIKTKIIENLAL